MTNGYHKLITPNLKRDPFFDFLRGLALIMVLLYHILPEKFVNGKLGIDLFFLISGYLITHSLVAGEKGGFKSLIDFAQKRIVRILPGFLALQFLVFILAYFVLTNEELKNFFSVSQSFHLFYSNFKLATLFGYFDPPAKLQFYTHTWSLSVEEQFYFLWMVAFAATSFSKNRMYTAVIVFFTGSLFYVYLLSDKITTQLHWDSFARLWVFSLGSLIYIAKDKFFTHTKPAHLVKKMNLLLVVYVLALFILVVVRPISQLAFVLLFAFATLWHCYAFDQNSLVNKLSQKSIFNFFGVVSYPIYLFFNPLSVGVFFLIGVKDQWATILTVIVAIVSGIAFHFTVEKWFMNSFKRKKKVYGLLIAWVLILGWIFLNLNIEKPIFSTALSNKISPLQVGKKIENYITNLCPFSYIENNSIEKCMYYSSKKFNRRTVVWADSAGVSLLPQFIKRFHEQEEDLTLISIMGCPALIQIDYVKHSNSNCRQGQLGQEVVDHIKQLKPDRVVLITNWMTFFWGLDWTVKETEDGSEHLKKILEAHKKLLSETIQELKKSRIDVVVTTIWPIFDRHTAFLMPRKQVYQGQFDSLVMSAEVYRRNSEKLNTLTHQLGEALDFKVIDLGPVFCDQQVCSAMNGNEVYYIDQIHWTPLGSKKVTDEIFKHFSQKK